MPATSIDHAFTATQTGRRVKRSDLCRRAVLHAAHDIRRIVKGADAVVWGIPFDAAVTNRPGARFGPQAIRRASAIFDNDPQYPFRRDLFETLAVVDYGDCLLDSGNHQKTPAAIEREAAQDSEDRRVPAVARRRSFRHLAAAQGACGGPRPAGPGAVRRASGHLARRRQAHRPRLLRRAAPCARASSIPTARSRSASARMRRRITASRSSTATRSRRCAPADIAYAITERTGGKKTYLTFDIDCLDPAFAPGTGTPVAGGPSSAKILSVLRQLTRIDIVGADVVEVAPAYDHADITAIAGVGGRHVLSRPAGRARRRG